MSFDSLCNSVSDRRLNVDCPLFLSVFNQTWIFSTDFQKNLQLPNSVQWELSCSMRACGRADRRFSQFCKRAQKKWIHAFFVTF